MILYKKTNTGAIQVWEITGSIKSSKITIKYGQLNGAMQTQIEDVETNQSGRTLKEQILHRMKSRISKQKDKGYRYTIEKAIEFEGKNSLNLFKPMLAQQFSKVKHINLKDSFYQLKYNGHRCLITRQNGKLIAYSRNGKIIDTIDHILDNIVLEEGHTIDGELYAHGYPLQTIASWIKRKQENTSKLKYVIYDIIMDEIYKHRLDYICSLHIHKDILISPTRSLDQLGSLSTGLTEAIKDGYEGLIIRQGSLGYEAGKRSQSLVKVKRYLDEEFKVLDITPSKDGWAVLTCETCEGRTFKVSAPGTMEDKFRVMADKHLYINNWIQVDFYEWTKDLIPFHPVATIWRNKSIE